MKVEFKLKFEAGGRKWLALAAGASADGTRSAWWYCEGAPRPAAMRPMPPVLRRPALSLGPDAADAADRLARSAPELPGAAGCATPANTAGAEGAAANGAVEEAGGSAAYPLVCAGA